MTRSFPRTLALTTAAIAATFLAAPAAAGPAPKTTRASLSSAGAQANNVSDAEAVSQSGRFVAFTSHASNLVAGDTNDASDVFVRDRKRHRTVRVDVSSRGRQANSDSSTAAISAGGRFVAFTSGATNLVHHDTNHRYDVFVRDRKRHTTTRVSLRSTGAQAHNHSFDPAISADGRYVAFASDAGNLVPGDTNHGTDVFVRDRRKHRTSRVSVSSAGAQATGEFLYIGRLAISADGRFVTFPSGADNLVPGDTNHDTDVFLRDRRKHRTSRVSVSSAGAQGTDGSFEAAVSAHGRYVLFTSSSPNLVAGDTNGGEDVFLRDRRRHKTSRVSVSSTGAQSNHGSGEPSISGAGRFVAFSSDADNLVPGDTNDAADVFVRDRRKHKTSRASLSSSGEQGTVDPNIEDPASSGPLLSGDGHFVAFTSWVIGLVAGDTNGASDVFVRGPVPR